MVPLWLLKPLVPHIAIETPYVSHPFVSFHHPNLLCMWALCSGVPLGATFDAGLVDRKILDLLEELAILISVVLLDIRINLPGRLIEGHGWGWPGIGILVIDFRHPILIVEVGELVEGSPYVSW